MKDSAVIQTIRRGFQSIDWLESIYLILFCGIVIFKYLLTTALEMEYGENIMVVLRYILFGYVVVRIVEQIIRNKKEVIFSVIVSIVLLISAGLVTYHTKDFELLDFVLLIIGAMNVKWKKIAVIYLCIAITIQAVAFYCVMKGIAPDFIYVLGQKVRHSLGISYPTDFAAHILFIMMVYVSLRNTKLTYFEITLMAIISYIVYGQTYAKNNFICSILLCASLFIVKTLHYFKFQISKFRISRGLGLVMFIMVLVCLICVMNYNPLNSLWSKMDRILSYRISLSYQGISQYGLPAFGTTVYESGAGMGGNTAYYFFLDSSLIRIAIKYGWIFLSVITYIYYLCMDKAIRYHKDYIIIVLLVMVIYGVVEHHLLELAYCPIWCMLFSRMTDDHAVARCNK